jgi:hypothetical protein
MKKDATKNFTSQIDQIIGTSLIMHKAGKVRQNIKEMKKFLTQIRH